MDHHISAQDFATFAAGELQRERARAILAHLLRGCEICQEEAETRWQLEARAAAVPQDAYDGAIDRAFAAVERELLLQQVSLAA